MTVKELLSRVDSKELTEWQLFFELEPWGSEVEDWRHGMVASTIANVNRNEKKRKKPFEPKDFMPRLAQEPVEAQSPEEQKRSLGMWTEVWKDKFGE